MGTGSGGSGTGLGVGAGVGDGTGTGVGVGDGTGTGVGVGLGDGTGTGLGVGDGTGLGVGLGRGLGGGLGAGPEAATVDVGVGPSPALVPGAELAVAGPRNVVAPVPVAPAPVDAWPGELEVPPGVLGVLRTAVTCAGTTKVVPESGRRIVRTWSVTQAPCSSRAGATQGAQPPSVLTGLAGDAAAGSAPIAPSRSPPNPLW